MLYKEFTWKILVNYNFGQGNFVTSGWRFQHIFMKGLNCGEDEIPHFKNTQFC